MYYYTTRAVNCYLQQQKRKTLEDVSAAGLVLHAQNFASATVKNVAFKST